MRCLILPGESSPILDRSPATGRGRPGRHPQPERLRPLVPEAEGAVLFHIAGVIHPRRVREFYQINVEGTKNLLDAAAAAGARQGRSRLEQLPLRLQSFARPPVRRVVAV